MKPLLTALLTIICFVCFAQQNLDSIYFAKLGKQELVQNYKNSCLNNLPFKAIRIIDARPDTSNVGFMKIFLLNDTKKLVFEEGLSSEILKFIGYNYKLNTDSTSNDLLLIIKQYRISNFAKTLHNRQYNTTDWNRGIVLSTELFSQNQTGYHALYKLDSIITNDSSNSLNTLIDQSFSSIFYKVSNKNMSDLHLGKTEFSNADIQQHLEAFYNYPILKDSVLKKGVYKNFIEFKNNDPSYTVYELREGNLSDEIFVNNQSYPLHDFWGLCNGKNVFIQSADNLFKLVRANRTYNLNGVKSPTIRQNHELNNPFSDYVPVTAFGKTSVFYNNRSPKIKLKYNVMQLNMQNGELY